jgi:hypothetical protein
MTTAITKKDFKLIYNRLKNSAKRRNIEFTITPTDIDEIGIPITCPILGIPIYFHRNKVEDDSISFDRIDSSKGYSVGNLVVISHRANKLKSNATLNEMERIVNFYKNLE